MSEIILLYSLSVLNILTSILVFNLYRKKPLNEPRKKLLRNEDGLLRGMSYPLQKLRTIKGSELFIPKNSNGQVLIFTSYSCNACKGIYPFLDTLIKEHSNIQFELLMLANKEEAYENIKKYNLENINITLIKQEQFFELGVTGFPFSYLLNNEGEVVEKGLINFKKDIEILLSYLSYYKKSISA